MATGKVEDTVARHSHSRPVRQAGRFLTRQELLRFPHKLIRDIAFVVFCPPLLLSSDQVRPCNQSPRSVPSPTDASTTSPLRLSSPSLFPPLPSFSPTLLSFACFSHLIKYALALHPPHYTLPHMHPPHSTLPHMHPPHSTLPHMHPPHSTLPHMHPSRGPLPVVDPHVFASNSSLLMPTTLPNSTSTDHHAQYTNPHHAKLPSLEGLGVPNLELAPARPELEFPELRQMGRRARKRFLRESRDRKGRIQTVGEFDVLFTLPPHSPPPQSLSPPSPPPVSPPPHSPDHSHSPALSLKRVGVYGVKSAADGAGDADTAGVATVDGSATATAAAVAAVQSPAADADVPSSAAVAASGGGDAGDAAGAAAAPVLHHWELSVKFLLFVGSWDDALSIFSRRFPPSESDCRSSCSNSSSSRSSSNSNGCSSSDSSSTNDNSSIKEASPDPEWMLGQYLGPHVGESLRKSGIPPEVIPPEIVPPEESPDPEWLLGQYLGPHVGESLRDRKARLSRQLQLGRQGHGAQLITRMYGAVEGGGPTDTGLGSFQKEKADGEYGRDSCGILQNGECRSGGREMSRKENTESCAGGGNEACGEEESGGGLSSLRAAALLQGYLFYEYPLCPSFRKIQTRPSPTSFSPQSPRPPPSPRPPIPLTLGLGVCRRAILAAAPPWTRAAAPGTSSSSRSAAANLLALHMAAWSASASRAGRASLRATMTALPLLLSLLLVHSHTALAVKNAPPPPPPDALSFFFPFLTMGSINRGNLRFASPPPPPSKNPPPLSPPPPLLPSPSAPFRSLRPFPFPPPALPPLSVAQTHMALALVLRGASHTIGALRPPRSLTGSAQVDYSCNGLMAGDATVMAPAPAPSPESPSPPPPPSTTPSPPPPSGGTPPTKGVLCPASTFDGYEYQLELGSGNYLLHWKFASNTVINFLLEARSNTIIKDAWMAVGFSKKGKMKGSDAVIGNLPGVGAFYMSGYRLKNIQQTSLSLGTTSVSTTSEGGTSIAFSRTVGTGNVPLKLNTTSYLIWAFAQTVTKKLYFHGMNQGGYAVDWACYQAPKALWGGGPDYDSDDSDVDKDYSGGPWQGASLPTDAAAADGAAGGLTATLVDQGQSSGDAAADAAAGDAAGPGNRKSGVRFYDGATGRSNGEWWQERSP
ncbi:unnamed protein product [Closterium sp. NIES-64]|nr:unnamed protein product [Closterium sp. NIES-64]